MLIDEFATLRRMPTGRYAFSLAEMRERTAAANLPEVVARIDRALEVARKVLGYERKWVVTRNTTSNARGQATLIDYQLDELIVAIEARLRADRVGADDNPQVILAKEL